MHQLTAFIVIMFINERYFLIAQFVVKFSSKSMIDTK